MTDEKNGTTDHSHTGFETSEHIDGDRFGAIGQIADGSAMARVVGAAFDGCVPCQQAQLDIIQDDPLTVARLVELSAVAINEMVGGIPPTMFEPDSSKVSEPYRVILFAGLDADDHAPMYELAVAMSTADRRRAADDALDMITGVLAAGS